MHLNFDRQKYLHILQDQGLPAALTALHHDLREWEFQAFEGDKGWQPDMWRDLEDVRSFSRELWDLGLKNAKLGRGAPARSVTGNGKL